MPRDNESFQDVSDEVNIVDAEEAAKAREFPGDRLNAMKDAFEKDKEKPKKKIAILGTTPTWQMAPFDDPTWDIWGIFGVALCSKRLDRLYELHRKEIIEPMVKSASPDGRYWERCRELGKNFITRDPYDQAPEATRFDFDAKLKKYGEYFASSASWIVADAIDEILKAGGGEIAIYGINMAAHEEYGHQKPSMTYLLGWAKCAGIKIILPRSSELLSITHQYGLQDPPAFIMSMAQRKHEVAQAMAQANGMLTQAQLQIANAQGAMAQIEWFEQNFNAEHKKAGG